ncbi:MAG: hypothetical protein WAW03_14780 [Anaerolineae bacterium]|nr:hypothetical protein [Anaerolineae bacterium]
MRDEPAAARMNEFTGQPTTSPPAAACAGACRKSNPFDPDNIWRGQANQNS